MGEPVKGAMRWEEGKGEEGREKGEENCEEEVIEKRQWK